jgi:hypothetical protein
MEAARHHGISINTALRRLRAGRWRYAEPYQIPAVALASRPRRSVLRG